MLLVQGWDFRTSELWFGYQWFSPGSQDAEPMVLTTIIRDNQKCGHITHVTKVTTPVDIHTKTLSYGVKAAVANFNFVPS